MNDRGSTLFELVAVLAAIAAPGAAGARRCFSGRAGAERLALVLRSAQARAQADCAVVRVAVAADGAYTVRELRDDDVVWSRAGELGAAVTTNYPSGSLEFGPSGWPCLAGSASPRAGSFQCGGFKVVVQLSGCVRCA